MKRTSVPSTLLLAFCLIQLGAAGEALAGTNCGPNLQRNNCVQAWQCTSSGEGTNGNWIPKTNEKTGTPCVTTSGLPGKCVAPSGLPGDRIEAGTCVPNCTGSSSGACGGSKSGTGTQTGGGSKSGTGKGTGGGRSGACSHTPTFCNLECGRGPGDLGTLQQWNACQSSCLSCGKDIPGVVAGTTGATNNNAIVSNVIQSPIYVNLYWDNTWDVDNPTMTMAAIDNFTASIINSSYFGGLREYGVMGATFAGSFSPDGACPARAPANVGLYDPISPSILGFLNCELIHGGIPQGPNVIYNLLLPQGSIESDVFGGLSWCVNGGAAWHFHQTPYTPAGAMAVATAFAGETVDWFTFLTGLAIGDPVQIAGVLSSIGPISAAQLLTSFEALQGPPFYTIVSVDCRCGNQGTVATSCGSSGNNAVVANSLLHEMLEAATDPSPSVTAILSGGIIHGEIVDKADDVTQANMTLCAPTMAFQAPSALGISCPVGSPFLSFTCFTDAPQYWSNAAQNCTIGFTNTAVPNVTSVSIAGTESQLTMTVTGNGGFGPAPILQPSATSGGRPYVGLRNLSQSWEAGLNGSGSAPSLALQSWSDTQIVLTGLQFSGSDLVLAPTDSLAAWVCNPASGRCSANTTVHSTVSGTPRIQVVVEDAPNVNVLFDIAIDGVTVATNLRNRGSTRWITALAGTPLAPGQRHSVVAKPTTEALVTTTFRGGCGADGSFVLAQGDNRVCIVSNSAEVCPAGQHCCGTVTASGACSTECISNAMRCVGGPGI